MIEEKDTGTNSGVDERRHNSIELRHFVYSIVHIFPRSDHHKRGRYVDFFIFHVSKWVEH